MNRTRLSVISALVVAAVAAVVVMRGGGSDDGDARRAGEPGAAAAARGADGAAARPERVQPPSRITPGAARRAGADGIAGAVPGDVGAPVAPGTPGAAGARQPRPQWDPEKAARVRKRLASLGTVQGAAPPADAPADPSTTPPRRRLTDGDALDARSADVLRRLDKDRDGVISRAELEAGGQPSKVLARADANGDGVLDASEIAAMTAAKP